MNINLKKIIYYRWDKSMVEYKDVQEVLKEKEISYPEFSFFDASGRVIKIMQWQPGGILSFEKKKGFWCGESLHSNKAESFLEKVRSEKADIVISPEYSFPWNVFKKMIDDETLHPKNGKLYCLGMEGISYENLCQFIKENENNLCIITEDFDKLQENSFFSCLLYLFKSDKKMICIIQLKTTPASDKWAEFESNGLTQGRTIYLFKSFKNDYCLTAYICADVLNQEIEEIKTKIPYQKCLILHPQLNPAPLHETFEQMRKNYLDYGKNSVRIISVNWAKGTVLPADGARNEIIIKDSFSACYYNGKWEIDEQDDKDLLKRNKAKGIDLAIKNHTIIWYMPESEHCMLYSIDGFSSNTLSNVTVKHKEPLGDTYYEYNEDEGQWNPETVGKVCRIDWAWLQSSFGFKQCLDGNCKVDLLYHFFHILLSGREAEDFTLDKENVQTIFNKEDSLNDTLIAWRKKSTYPDNALKKGKIPTKFSRFKDENYEWVLDPRGNIKEKNSTVSEHPCCVIYIDSEVDELIQKKISRFCSYMGESACDRLIVYYSSCDGIQFYEKHYNNEINNPNNYNVSSCIK